MPPCLCSMSNMQSVIFLFCALWPQITQSQSSTWSRCIRSLWYLVQHRLCIAVAFVTTVVCVTGRRLPLRARVALSSATMTELQQRPTKELWYQKNGSDRSDLDAFTPLHAIICSVRHLSECDTTAARHVCSWNCTDWPIDCCVLASTVRVQRMQIDMQQTNYTCWDTWKVPDCCKKQEIACCFVTFG